MGRFDESSDVAEDWSTEALDLIRLEQEQAAFGRYVLGYEIASGGMGTVYLAREQGPGGFTRPVAIKRIHPHLARKRRFVEMFLDEARVAARIIHPNVCSVYGFGDVDGTHYIAMEYLVGQPLSEVAPRVGREAELADSPRWHAMAARIVMDACEGLHAAHELRDEAGEPLHVVHRDVSTHNIFVTYDGAVKVLDFGIARARGRRYETRTGAVKGKLAYMSPEQARASKTIDRRSDVWSLGVVLWELLALRRLFGRRSEVELLRAVGEEPIVPPSLVRPEIPPALDAIVMRALERDVDVRYPSARALARDLGGYISQCGEGTSLADVGELLSELFAEQRAGKLVAVATVLHTDTADRVVSDPPRPPPPPAHALRASGRVRHWSDEPTHLLAAPEASDAARAETPEPLAEPTLAGETPPTTSSTSVERPSSEASAAPRRAPTETGRARRWVWLAVPASFAIIGAVAAIALRAGGPGGSAAERAPSATPTGTASPSDSASTAAPPPDPLPEGGRAGRRSEPVPATASASDSDSDSDSDSESVPASDSASDSDSASGSTAAPPPDPEGAGAERASTSTSGSASDSESSPAPAEPAPRARARPQMGQVNVAASGGWADIYVRGERVARTPTVLRLPAGEQVITLRANGTGPPRRVTVQVRAGHATRVVVPLRPMATTSPY